ncbi:hypothetical protein SAMN05444166_6600 [Singulisphaera sp. GP187]|uniref:hypothetical protein n=1 Tax=Singulisphaera sp. GP187 TaxID=1882752 RepID=UPI000927F746|nr:hypothetical protein [Singulisphaera sp. GP187]SIO60993.1 hypothetical protein SAMN05444166_6600 [Singulisphaera sp. GP187]
MEPARGPHQHDPDLDRPPARAPIVLEPYFEEYQRLVSNPFLALAALIPWFAATRLAFLAKHVPSILILLASLVAIAGLLQFHCLDCGATGCLFRWKHHACQRSLARQWARQRRRLRGPNPATQTVLWGFIVMVVALLSAIASRNRF